MTLRALYQAGADRLSAAGVPDAELDARLLLCEAFQMTAGEYLFSCDRELSELYDPYTLSGLQEDYENEIALRCRRVPLQQILGTAQFMGLEFAVNGDVLIPRQDTETLVEQVLYDFPERDISVLDMCTGSGCIAASLAVLGGYREVIGADLSREALYVAQENAMRLLREAKARTDMKKSFLSAVFSRDEEEYQQQVHFIQSDLFSGLSEALSELGSGPFDVIVSNPPYIPTAEIEELEPEVRDFEPRMALDGSQDGLHFYRRFAKEAGPFLKEGGSLYLEIGAEEAAAVRGLLQEAGYRDIRVIKDLCGRDRVVCARKQEKRD